MQIRHQLRTLKKFILAWIQRPDLNVPARPYNFTVISRRPPIVYTETFHSLSIVRDLLSLSDSEARILVSFCGPGLLSKN
ncbi:hypothetical protein JCM19992_17670 [Thermostilla marina]